MSDDKGSPKAPAAAPARILSPEAERALAEAAERRKARDEKGAANPAKPAAREIGGRDGLDPARFGDWEKDGIISDF